MFWHRTDGIVLIKPGPTGAEYARLEPTVQLSTNSSPALVKLAVRQ